MNQTSKITTTAIESAELPTKTIPFKPNAVAWRIERTHNSSVGTMRRQSELYFVVL